MNVFFMMEFVILGFDCLVIIFVCRLYFMFGVMLFDVEFIFWILDGVFVLLY